MVDEQKNKMPDDEYQFPQDEYVSPESEGHVHLDEDAGNPATTEATATATSKLSVGARIAKQLREMPPLKNKRIIIVVVAVIAVIIFFRFMHSSKPKPAQPTPAPVEQVVTPQPTNNNQMSAIDSMSEQTSRTESQIKTLQSQLADLQNAISQSQTTQLALQKSVSDLTTSMQMMSEQLNKVMLKGPHRHAPSVVYHLRAVLPDRAWITSTTGKTLTVTVGNHIPQYGTVRVIDAQQGIIETSSGRKIVYGTNDY